MGRVTLLILVLMRECVCGRKVESVGIRVCKWSWVNHLMFSRNRSVKYMYVDMCCWLCRYSIAVFIANSLCRFWTSYRWNTTRVWMMKVGTTWVKMRWWQNLVFLVGKRRDIISQLLWLDAMMGPWLMWNFHIRSIMSLLSLWLSVL